MAKKDPIRTCTDEYLLRQILADARPGEMERIALRSALEEVCRLRPITHTRAKLSRHQRDAVEERFRALGLDEGLKEKLMELRGPAAVAALDPLAGIPTAFIMPLKPPGKCEGQSFEPQATWKHVDARPSHHSLRGVR
jgi:hypothetical protein